MVTTEYRGRMGNNMIQYIAAYIFAKKNNLKLISEPKHHPVGSVGSDWGSYFHLPPLYGGDSGSGKVILNDDNYIQYLNSESVGSHHYHLNGFFQTKELLYNYRDEIKNLFKLNYSDIEKDVVFVAYRIGDVEGYRQMLPKEYYIEALEMIKPKGGYITSDTINHPFVKELSDKYNLKQYIPKHPLEKIDFAKNFNNLILSEGTFSWWMCFLSKAENVIINERDFNWFGRDIFDHPKWKKLYWDYDKNSIGLNNKLVDYRPIKLN